MITLVIATIATSSLSQEPNLAPLCPPSSSKGFQKQIQTLSQHLYDSKFELASQKGQLLPKKSFKVSIDLSNIEQKGRARVSKAVEAGINAWDKGVADVNITLTNSESPDLKITFEKILPNNPDTGLPKSSVFFLGSEPSEPRIESVIGLRRLKALVSIEDVHISQETMFSIGSYFGLNRGLFGPASTGDNLSVIPLTISPSIKVALRRNFEVVDAISEAVKSKTRLTPATTSIFIDTKELQLGTVNQGDYPEKQFTVFNRGNAPLSFQIVPDCSCFQIFHKGTVPAGGSAVVKIMMNTTDFVGKQLKNLFIYSNDPDKDRIIIPVKTDINAAYWFESLSPDVIYASDKGASAKIRLIIPKNQDIKPHSISVAGVTGNATYTPWQGKATNPSTGKEIAAKGYEIDLLVAPLPRPGRTFATIQVLTNNDVFKRLNHNLHFQKGISISPQVLYFGEVTTKSANAWAIISQPNRPFKIKQLASDHSSLKASYEQISEDEYKIIVSITGEVRTGRLNARVTVKTDDPDSPEIILPVQGIIK